MPLLPKLTPMSSLRSTTDEIRQVVTDLRDHFRVVVSLGGWAAVSSIALLSLGLLTFESLYLIWYLGVIAGMQVYTPVDSKPDWWKYLQWIAVIGFVIFMVVIYWRIAAVVEI